MTAGRCACGVTLPVELVGKYGRDHGERLLMGTVVDRLLELRRDRERFLAALDELFLVGAWGEVLEKLGETERLLLRADLRSLVWLLASAP